MPRRRLPELLVHHPDFQPSHVSGPLPFLHPTRVSLQPAKVPSASQDAATSTGTGTSTSTDTSIGAKHPSVILHHHPIIEHLWRSRDNRKGRHAIRVFPPPPSIKEQVQLPRKTTSIHSIRQGLWRMLTTFAYWDVSYWVATIFTWGSVVWVINACFVWLPLVAPRSEFPNESYIGGGVTGFIGATIFEVGSVLLLLEAVNENQTACFGWAVETALRRLESGHEKPVVKVEPAGSCLHSHANKRSFLGLGHRASHVDIEHRDESSDEQETTGEKENRTFKWIPSMDELRTHYFRELGFQASLVQFIGATIFWIAGFTGLPGIANHLSQRVENGVYWVPQMVGGMCFVISGLLFTLETQAKWYLPAPHVLGWHIGAWNFVGGIGFTLCGALGPATTHSGVEYEATLATFWGSWAFLIGSTIQWYESLQKYPVEMA